MKHYGVLLAVAFTFVSLGHGAEQRGLAEDILERYSPHMARVQYHLTQHQGDEPRSAGFVEKCSNCGRYHINRASSALQERRPAELPGIFISSDTIVSADPILQQRFIERVTVEAGGKIYEAKVEAYASNRSAVRLRLTESGPALPELEFERAGGGALHALTLRQLGAGWILRSTGLSQNLAIDDAGRRIMTVKAPALVVDQDGNPITITANTKLGYEDWDASPSEWEWLSLREIEEAVERTESVIQDSIVRVLLNFRTPRTPSGSQSSMRFHSSNEDVAEKQALGVMLDQGRILILTELKPRTTARLERIRVFFENPEGEEISADAEFIATLNDFGAMLAKLSQADVPEIEFLDVEPSMLSGAFWPAAHITLSGNSVSMRAGHARLDSFKYGWRNQLIPDMRGTADDTFVFDRDGRLLLLPISLRDRTVSPHRYTRRLNVQPTLSRSLIPILENLHEHMDLSNVPLCEEEEGRLAWLGVELQEISDEMARYVGIQDSRFGSRAGALVSYVYPDSPAENMGIESGMVLLRVRIDGQPQSMDVQVADHYRSSSHFSWDQLDMIPAEYFEMIPQPWPSASNSLNIMLTDIGAGQAVAIEIFDDGDIREKEFVIERGPPHYDVAAREVSDEIGATLRDLTYETRRFYRRPDGEPGLVVSEVVPGGRAATAGLKPFEIITHVNDVPMNNVDDWREAIDGETNLRISVRRMARGRVIQVGLQ